MDSLGKNVRLRGDPCCHQGIVVQGCIHRRDQPVVGRVEDERRRRVATYIPGRRELGQERRRKPVIREVGIAPSIAGQVDRRVTKDGEIGPAAFTIDRIGGTGVADVELRRQHRGQVATRRESDHSDPARIEIIFLGVEPNPAQCTRGVDQLRGVAIAVPCYPVAQNESGHAVRSKPVGDLSSFEAERHAVVPSAWRHDDRRSERDPTVRLDDRQCGHVPRTVTPRGRGSAFPKWPRDQLEFSGCGAVGPGRGCPLRILVLRGVAVVAGRPSLGIRALRHPASQAGRRFAAHRPSRVIAALSRICALGGQGLRSDGGSGSLKAPDKRNRPGTGRLARPRGREEALGHGRHRPSRQASCRHSAPCPEPPCDPRTRTPTGLTAAVERKKLDR